MGEFGGWGEKRPIKLKSVTSNSVEIEFGKVQMKNRGKDKTGKVKFDKNEKVQKKKEKE